MPPRQGKHQRAAVRAFSSADYTVPLGRHSYPMDKYRLVPERLLADGTLTPDEILAPQPIPHDDILRVHTPGYVYAFCSGGLEHRALLRLGLPWSAALVRRAFMGDWRDPGSGPRRPVRRARGELGRRHPLRLCRTR